MTVKCRQGLSDRRGIALLIVVGVLGVLAIMATGFVMMARLERGASRQRLLSTKAYLLARSGIEDALARLDGGQDSMVISNLYQGEDWDGSGGALDAFEAGQEIHRPGQPDRDDCPLHFAMRPSFHVRISPASPASNPAYARVDGRLRGYSGGLKGDFSTQGNHYALKISQAGGFFVNGGNPAVLSNPTLTTDYNTRLQRMLGILAEAIDREVDGVDDNLPVGTTDGERLVSLRPLSGWSSFDQIRTVALGASQAKLEALKPYLCLRAWVDKRVITSNVRGALADRSYSSWGALKADRPHASVATLAPDFERVPAPAVLQPLGAIVGRAPVDLAWARTRRPALIALLAGLRGYYLDEWTATNATLGDVMGTLREAEIQNSWNPADDCHVAAQAIVNAPLPSSWAEWNQLCDAIAFTGVSDLPQAKRDILKANFNPNSDLNKFNPGLAIRKMVDKSDLAVYSTEFSLYPLGGRDLESLGRVLAPNGKLLASRALRVSLPGPSVARLSTQREFVCESLGRLDDPGDEQGTRMPGYCDPTTRKPAFISLCRGNLPAWGHRLDTTACLPAQNYSLANGNWMDGDSPGAALQSYPEPCFDTTPGGPGTAPSIRPADFDGFLEIAGLETPDQAFYGVPLPNDLKMLARFDDSFDLDVSDAFSAGNPLGKDCQTDTSQVTAGELGNSLMSSAAGKMNTLYPDGAYSEPTRVPAYLSRLNANGFRGVISFWVKPNFDIRKHNLASATWGRARGHPFLNWTHRTGSGGADFTQFFFLGYCNIRGQIGNAAAGVSSFAAFYETCHVSTATEMLDDHAEFEFVTPPRADAAHSWHLFSHYWNLQATDEKLSGEMHVDAGTAAQDRGFRPGQDDDQIYGQPNGNGWPVPYDITQDNYNGPHMLNLGWRGPTGSGNYSVLGGYVGSSADATIDEFAIYDFGTNQGSPGTLSAARYQDGRFYKGSRYVNLTEPGIYNPLDAATVDLAPLYFSPVIQLPAGAKIQKVAWTWLSSPSQPADYAEIALVRPGADGYLWSEASSRSTSGTLTGQIWTLERMVPGPFRIQAVFRRPAALTANVPLLDSPVLDDLSVVYQSPGGGILSWTNGN